MNIISVGTELEIKGLRVAFFIPGMQNGQTTYHLPSFGSAVELDSNHLEIISDVTASIIPFRYNTHLTIMIVREIHRQLKNDKSGTTKHIVTGLYKTTVDKETFAKKCVKLNKDQSLTLQDSKPMPFVSKDINILWAKPQITVGVARGKLCPFMLNVIYNNYTNQSGMWIASDPYGDKASANRPLEAGVFIDEAVRDWVTTLIGYGGRKNKQGLWAPYPDKRNIVSRSIYSQTDPGGLLLLTLVIIGFLHKSPKTLRYFKGCLSILPRTSLGQVYDALSESDKHEYVRLVNLWANGVGESGGLPRVLVLKSEKKNLDVVEAIKSIHDETKRKHKTSCRLQSKEVYDLFAIIGDMNTMGEYKITNRYGDTSGLFEIRRSPYLDLNTGDGADGWYHAVFEALNANSSAAINNLKKVLPISGI